MQVPRKCLAWCTLSCWRWSVWKKKIRWFMNNKGTQNTQLWGQWHRQAKRVILGLLLMTRWLTEAGERIVHRTVGWAGEWSCSRREHWNIFQITFSLLLKMYQLRSYRGLKVLDVLNHLRNKSWNIFIIKRFSNAGTF